MTPVVWIIVLSTLAGLAMPTGALLATAERIHPMWMANEVRHAVIAFGGGVLLSAVALVLVPDGAAVLALPWVVVLFLSGGVVFLIIDRILIAIDNPASQLVAMLSDFIPEALALGAAFAMGKPTGTLLAVLITLQNLPEGFNAYREIVASRRVSGRHLIIGLACLVPLGPLAALAGFYWLANLPEVVGAVMLFAGGGILYLTFQDIAPQAKLRNRQVPAIGAVVGFLCGVVGHMLIAHKGVRVDTVRRFKGLEADVVFLWGIDALPHAEEQEMFYVGLSRAKSRLTVVGSRASCDELLTQV